ncbi:MAG: ammonium transporter, partial [Desulfotomaculales bacterium]
VLAVGFFDRIRADDPVGAIAVHGVNGTWGALAVGLFAQNGGLFSGGGLKLLAVQALGVLSVSVFAFAATYLVFSFLKKTVGVRVSAREEFEGLDLNEHGIPAYTGLVATPLYDVEENPAHALGGANAQAALMAVPQPAAGGKR